MAFRSLGRALASRNYRLFFFGQSISLIGTWMQQIALVWLVYRLSGSEFLLGMVGFCGQIPSFFLAPLAGVLIERWNRHRALMVTQSLAMLQAFALVVLVGLGWIEVWHVLLLSLAIGLVNSFDMPTRQSFLVQMIDRPEDLSNAIALNSSVVNAARLVGPTAAGLLIAWGGEWFCFVVNAASYLPVLAALSAMRNLRRRELPPQIPMAHSLREGFRYAFGFPPIRALLLLLALVSLAGMSLTVLMPVFAERILRGGPQTLGFLMAASGAGALTAAMYMASRATVLGLGRQIMRATGLLGLAMIAFSFSRTLWLSLLILPVTGFCMMLQMAANNTLLQTIVDEDKRGRVMSYYTMAFMGMAPLGSLLAGVIAHRFSAPIAVRSGGIACVLGAMLFGIALPRIREMVRPIYQRAGILESATAVQTSSELNVPPERP